MSVNPSSPRRNVLDPMSALLEMRVYAARPGRRHALVAMFEETFRPLYEALGTHILGSFVDLDAPNRWVWFRGFPDAGTRGVALTAFYQHPVWQARRTDCNALIARSSDARLLQPEFWTLLGNEETLTCTRRVGAAADREARPFAEPRTSDAEVVGLLVSSPAPNTYPRQRLRREPTRVVLTRGWCAPHLVADGASVQRWRLAPTLRPSLTLEGDHP